MAKKQIVCKEFNIDNLTYDEIAELFDPWEFQVILNAEPYDEQADSMFQDMLHYYLMVENYEFAVCLRDEINKRTLAYEMIGLK